MLEDRVNRDPAAFAEAQTRALALLPDPPGPWQDARLQRLWLATQSREWQSLAIMAASESVETLPIAETLAQIAWCYQGQPTCAYDLRDLSLRLADHQIQEVRAQAGYGTRVLVALRSPAENPTALLVARETDAVLLCIAVDGTEIRTVERAIDDIGRERILGTILIHRRAGKRAGR
jgi:hypothetical protein